MVKEVPNFPNSESDQKKAMESDQKEPHTAKSRIFDVWMRISSLKKFNLKKRNNRLAFKLVFLVRF